MAAAAAVVVAGSGSPQKQQQQQLTQQQPSGQAETALQYSFRHQQPLTIQMPMQTGISPNHSTLPVAAALPAAQLPSAVPPAYPMAPQFAASPTSAQSAAQMAAIMAAASAAANSQSIAAQQNNNSVFYSPMHQVHMSTEDPTGQAAAAAMYAAQTAAAANAASQQQVVYIPSTDHSSYLYGTLQPDPFQTASAASESALIMPNAKDSSSHMASPSSTSSSCGSNYSAMMYHQQQQQPQYSQPYQPTTFYSPVASPASPACHAEVRISKG